MPRPGTETRSWRLLDLLQEACGFLASRQQDSPRLEAELLLACALGVRRLDLYLQFDKLLTADQVAVFRGLVRQRLRGRPVQYITGHAGFRLLDLEVDERVLVPRPETEILVEEALSFLRALPDGPVLVLDVGCGSGAIALSVAREHPAAAVVATDLSAKALALAARNAARCGLAGRVRFLCGDLFAPLRQCRSSAFHAILSNPPYVATAQLGALQPEVRDHEPRLALDGGADGLDVIRRIATSGLGHLRPGGRLYLEVGDGQAAAVANLLGAAGFGDLVTRPDLNGTPRVVIGASPG